MGKMGELNAEGVTDLHSYNVGYDACREDVRKMITKCFDVEGLEKIPAHWALRIVLLSLNDTDEETEDGEENTKASS
jgi:hypothetical protein